MSKFYHYKNIEYKEKKLINSKILRFNYILLWIQLDTNLFELGMPNSQSTPHLARTLRCSVPALLRNLGGGIKTHSSVCLLVCLSVPLSVTKTLTLLISSEILNDLHLVTMAFTLTYFKVNLLWPPGDNNYPNLIVKFTMLFRHDVINRGGG